MQNQYEEALLANAGGRQDADTALLMTLRLAYLHERQGNLSTAEGLYQTVLRLRVEQQQQVAQQQPQQLQQPSQRRQQDTHSALSSAPVASALHNLAYINKRPGDLESDNTLLQSGIQQFQSAR